MADVRSVLQMSLILANLSDPEFDPPPDDGGQMTTASNIFLQVLDQYRDQVPYWQEKTLNNEGELVNIGASSINYIQYVLNNITYELTQVTQLRFSQEEVVLGLRALPEIFWFDKNADTVRVYPLPDISTRQFRIGFKPIIDASQFSQALPQGIYPEQPTVFGIRNCQNVGQYLQQRLECAERSVAPNRVYEVITEHAKHSY